MRFLLTRPKAQAAKLKNMLMAHQHTALVLPVIAINDIADSAPAIGLIEKLSSFDIVIFISANAVHQSVKYIHQYAAKFSLNDYLKIAVIGPSTASAVAEHGWQVDIMPKAKFDSDGLLQTEKLLSVAGKKIIIFKGLGGRDVLYDNLVKRGASVAQAITYERSLPIIDDSKLEQVLSPQVVTKTQNKDGLDGIIVMSNESLQNLYTLAGVKYRDKLLSCQLVVISQRCADLAQNLKFKNPAIIASTPDEAAIFKALTKMEYKYE